MKINQLTLHNYRCYPELHIEFNPDITVLVARNGQGKTAVLDAITVAVGPYILNQLTVKPATRPKRSTKPFGMGDVVKYKGKRYVVKGYMGNYLGFVGQNKYNHLMSKSQLIIKNQGIVCI